MARSSRHQISTGTGFTFEAPSPRRRRRFVPRGRALLVAVAVTVAFTSTAAALTYTPASASKPSSVAAAGLLADMVAQPTSPASATARVGVPVRFVFNARNTGSLPATAVTLTIVVPSGLEVVQAESGCVPALLLVACTGVLVAGGASVSRWVEFRATDTGVRQINADWLAVGELALGDNRSTASLTSTPGVVADLNVMSTPASLPADATMRNATWAVSNTGPEAAQATFTISVPDGITVGTLMAGCTRPSATVVTCDLGTVNNGGWRQVRLPVSASGGARMIVGVATHQGTDPDPTDDRDSVLLAADAADMRVTLTGSKELVSGVSSTMNLEVLNDGPNGASATVEVTGPTGWTWTPTAGCSVAGVKLTCTFGVIASGTRRPMSIAGSGSVAGQTTLSARVTGSAADPVPANDVATHVATVSPLTGNLNVLGLSGPTSLLTSILPVPYVATVRNDGPNPIPLSEITIGTNLNLGLLTGPLGCGLLGLDILCSTSNWAVGEIRTFTFLVIGQYRGTGLINIAASALGDPSLDNNTAQLALKIGFGNWAPGERIAPA